MIEWRMIEYTFWNYFEEVANVQKLKSQMFRFFVDTKVPGCDI